MMVAICDRYDVNRRNVSAAGAGHNSPVSVLFSLVKLKSAAKIVYHINW